MPQNLPADAPDRRDVLKWTAALAGMSAAGVLPAEAHTAGEQTGSPAAASPGPYVRRTLDQKQIGFVMAHEQFPVSELVRLGAEAAGAGFDLLATSDHFQPWQSNQGNAGQAWITLGATGSLAQNVWMGTHVTCPTLRYNPAVVAEAFATLDRLYPGRIFLGVGSGEALNEQAATGIWPVWHERWERLIEAITIIRALWTGQEVAHKGKYYTVHARLYEPPKTPIPLLTAANGPKAMRLAGTYGDGLITDPKTWMKYKPIWEEAARDAGKDPSKMPVVIEHFVVVGDHAEAVQAAEYWRFLPKAWHYYFDIENPTKILQKADAEIPIDSLLEQWTVGPDAQTHVAGVQKLFDSGVTVVAVHSGQSDQKRVIDFYATQVLPHFRA